MIEWTPHNCTKLKRLWQEGLTAPVIAKEFGTTRCAILGKINRLGLSGSRKQPAKPGTNGRKAVLRPAGQKRASPAKPIEDEKIPISSRKTIYELTEHTCRWPVGEPGTDNFFFCGMAIEEGLPYCPGHCLRAYSPHRDAKPFIPMRRAA